MSLVGRIGVVVVVVVVVDDIAAVAAGTFSSDFVASDSFVILIHKSTILVVSVEEASLWYTRDFWKEKRFRISDDTVLPLSIESGAIRVHKDTL